jgi:restriction system protein
MTRAGKYGEREQFALDNGRAVIGWPLLSDLADVADRDDLIERLRAEYPIAGEKLLTNNAAQLWAFVRRIEVGDLIALPLKTTPAIAIGRTMGPYKFEPDNPADARHTRPVEWIRTVPRSAVGQDLLYSLGAFLTVCEIKRNGAAGRFASIVESGRDPGAASEIRASSLVVTDVDDEPFLVDVEQFATDRMRAFIAERFTGHDLARLVEAILQAQGFITFRAPPGADGGIDVLAGAGPLGMESPRLCVQVKSGDSPVDVKVVRELQGVMTKVDADQALLVAWAGLTKPAELEARAQFFRLRVWTADDVIDATTTVYDRLPDDLQAELPLKRIWTVVQDSATE